MEKVAVVFTVFFEEPFWCGVYQRQEGRNLEAARMVFGAEPVQNQRSMRCWRFCYRIGNSCALGVRIARPAQ